MKIVVYTAIIGEYDHLQEPSISLDNVDFVCFTDRDLESDIWKIRKTLPLYEDNTRTARKLKILPHRLFPEYEISVWVDGNMLVRGDVNEYVKSLGDFKVATFDHMLCFDKRNCIYEEANAIFRLGQEHGNRFKDNPQTILNQMNRYLEDKYPANNRLVFTCGIVRKHNDKQVVKLMEDWWTELKYGSKRDQLSLNYVCWKNNFNLTYLPGDGRNNEIIKLLPHI